MDKNETSYPAKKGIPGRCIILHDESWCRKFLEKIHLSLFLYIKMEISNVITTSYFSKTSLTICASLETVYTAVKSVQEPSIMGRYPTLKICRTAGFKVD